MLYGRCFPTEGVRHPYLQHRYTESRQRKTNVNSTHSAAALQLESPGLGVSIQDRGRIGHRSIGVPVSGALDPLFLAAANALAGNPPETAGLEVLLAGPLLRAEGGPVRVALAGEMDARHIDAAGERRPVAAWSTVTLQAGDRLQVGSPRGVGYLAVAGGILTPHQLGSLATYARAGLGLLPASLPCTAFAGDTPEWIAPAPLLHPDGPIRVIVGPQIDHFDADAREAFAADTFTVTPERDRMGLRLAGPQLAHNARGADIVSDGVTPGTIQVPADGRAIVLLADCQTVGGYPKLAVVIRADLPRLAHLQPGDGLRFRFVDAAEAAAARADAAHRLAKWIAALRPRGTAGTDSAALLAANLAGAAVRGDEDDIAPQAFNASPTS